MERFIKILDFVARFHLITRLYHDPGLPLIRDIYIIQILSDVSGSQNV